MPRSELRFQCRRLIEIKRTYKQTNTSAVITRHDIRLEKTYYQSGVKVESRSNFVFTLAYEFVFD